VELALPAELELLHALPLFFPSPVWHRQATLQVALVLLLPAFSARTLPARLFPSLDALHASQMEVALALLALQEMVLVLLQLPQHALPQML